jgi:FkbM family methyltransferase
MKTGLAKGLKRRYGMGFRPRFSLSKEERFLMGLDLYGKTVYDVGAYIGIYTLFFARAVGQMGRVVAFEPNPGNYEELVHNVQLNGLGNVATLNLGLGSSNDSMALLLNPIYPTRSALVQDSMKDLPAGKALTTVTVQVASLDSLIKELDLPRPDFVKVDVEGFEVEVLHGMGETLDTCHPTLFVELHGTTSKEVIGFVLSKGYTSYHVESKTKIRTSDITPFSAGHLLCALRDEPDSQVPSI